jgi:hypothetical protein
VLLALAAFSVDGFIGRRAHMVEQRRSVRNAAQRFQVRALGQCPQPDSLLPPPSFGPACSPLY